jgi:hypothetical protein
MVLKDRFDNFLSHSYESSLSLTRCGVVEIRRSVTFFRHLKPLALAFVDGRLPCGSRENIHNGGIGRKQQMLVFPTDLLIHKEFDKMKQHYESGAAKLQVVSLSSMKYDDPK